MKFKITLFGSKILFCAMRLRLIVPVASLLCFAYSIRVEAQPNTWQTTLTSTGFTSRDGLVVAAVDTSAIYAIGGAINAGGTATGVIEKYYLPGTNSPNTWDRLVYSEEFPSVNSASVSVPGQIYVFGGMNGASSAMESSYLNFTQIFTPSSGTWTLGGPMPIPVQGATACVLGDTVYVIGGLVPNANQTGTVQIETVQKYDLSSGHFTEKDSLFEAAAAASSAVYNGKIYLFGGNKDGNVQEYTNGTWQPITNLPVPVYNSTASVVGDKIYVIGGSSVNNTSEEDQVQVFNPFDPTSWSFGSTIGFTPEDHAGTVVVKNNIYVMGGEVSTGPPTPGLVQAYIAPSSGVVTTPVPISLSQVYPNPSTGEFTIVLPDGAGVISRIEMLDEAGHIVADLTHSAGSDADGIHIKSSGITFGTYFVRVDARGGEYLYKIIINRDGK